MTQVRPREAQQILESMVVARYQMYPEYRDTGIEWLGEIPAHWEVRRLKFLANDINQQKVEIGEDEVYLQLENIEGWTGRYTIPEDTVSNFESTAKAFQPDDVLFGKLRPYLAKVIVSKHYGACVGELLVLRVRENTILPKFLALRLLTREFIDVVDASTYGAKMPRANWGFIGNLEIPFPPDPDEQRAITVFLDRQTAKIDALIAKKRELIAALHEKRSAIISHAVTKGLNPDAPMKDSGIEWLGEIPAGWDIIALKHALRNYEYGISASLSGTGSYRVLTMGHVQDSKLLIPEEGCLTERPSLFLQHHDLVFNRTNSLELVGKVGIFEGVEADEISIASYLVRMQTNDRANPLYLNYLLNSGWMLAEAKSRALPSINQANLNPTRYTNIKIPLPPRTEQETIISYLDHQVGEIDAVIMTAEATIERLQEYRSALISAAVTGRIDVRGKAGVS